ncbi:ATP-binding protein [Duganella sp. sic0402]|uniref:ATP-binding SpoIIE family protein phosphatase n=1 Tax=Duganella sp. sic0402 TaxID=2854786 RepID=UPI001C43B96D|nr:ATP-binding SpoIIE family protein phosphatase [Duganella sp. sic0402]MBV7536801.1 ATP-binding protein [Duganella sp. sic0402]
MENLSSTLDPVRWVAIHHASDAAEARRVGQGLAAQLGLSETRSGQLAIMVTEAATNILKHAGDGRMQLAIVNHGGLRCIEVLAIDQGPGIANLAQAMTDGVSSAGTAGTGLGAMRRLADQFDWYSAPGKGTVIFLRLWQAGTPARLPQLGGVCLPLASETVSGDAWAVRVQADGLTLLAADGLGHGPEAAKAADAALAVLAAQSAQAPSELMLACHQALRPTRGAAVAIAALDSATQQLKFAGVGNISACIIGDEGRRQLMSHNGIVGHNMRKVQDLLFPCPRGATVILASDGIGTNWDLATYPGLLAREPAVIAAVLLRDYSRGRDDASVLVVRMPESAA